MTQAVTRQTYPAAELDRRFYAFAIDRLLAWSVYAGAGYAAYRFLIEPGDTWAGIAVIAGVVLVVGLAFAVVLGIAGVSPGKALVGLRVVRQEDGRPIGVAGGGAAHDRARRGGAADVRPGRGHPGLDRGDGPQRAAPRRPRPDDRGGGRRHPPAAGAGGGGRRAAAADRQPHRDAADAVAPEQPVETPASPAPAAAPAPAPAPAPEPAAARRRPRHPPRPAGSRPGARPPRPALGAVGPTGARLPAPAASAVPGQPIATQRRVDTTAPAAIWRVSFDTGESFVVEGLALVGRRPEARGGEPVRHLVPLRSRTCRCPRPTPSSRWSRRRPGGDGPGLDERVGRDPQGVSKPLTAGRPATLLDGDTVRFGDRSMTVTREG